MATRENQGLQIALIIFLIITVALSISTYVYFRKAEELAKEADAANAKAAASDQRYKSMHYQVQAMKYMIGVPNITPEGLAALRPATADDGMKEVDRIKVDFDNDMALFDDTIPATDRHWRTLPKFLLSSLMNRSNLVDTAVTAEKKVIADTKVAIDAKDKAVEVHKAGQEKAAAEANEARQEFVAAATESAKGKGENEVALEKLRQDLAKQAAEAAKFKNDADQKEKNLVAEARGKAARIAELTNESFERPHGKITWVNMRNQTCYINLGSADGLQRQVTFSVYDPGVTTLEVPNAADERKKDDKKTKTLRKASIEVTQVLEDHLAECRILEDDIKNPLLPGDQIFTPAWRPGERLQFALVGRMRIDDDREDDRQKVKNLIEANGGQVVAEVLDNGKLVGKINPNTRFLVIGERPEDASDEQVRAAFNDILGAAERNGVQQISVRDLVSMMGYKGTDRTVPLSRTGAAEVEKKPDAKSQFRPRPKPAAADAGAF